MCEYTFYGSNGCTESRSQRQLVSDRCKLCERVELLPTDDVISKVIVVFVVIVLLFYCLFCCGFGEYRY